MTFVNSASPTKNNVVSIINPKIQAIMTILFQAIAVLVSPYAFGIFSRKILSTEDTYSVSLLSTQRVNKLRAHKCLLGSLNHSYETLNTCARSLLLVFKVLVLIVIGLGTSDESMNWITWKKYHFHSTPSPSVTLRTVSHIWAHRICLF